MNAYVRFRQRHKPRKAPRLFYTLELSSALALAWWIDHWPRQEGIWVPLGLVLGIWLGARSEWPLQRGKVKDTSSKILGSLAALAGFEFARELRHHHGDLHDKSTRGPR